MRLKMCTPEDFRRGQTDLLSQANELESFLRSKQHANQQQQARTTWLLTQQRLEQEAQECAAQLDGWLADSSGSSSRAGWLLPNTGGPSFHAGSHGGQFPDDCCWDVSTQLAALLPSSSLAEAVAVATAAASLLNAGPDRVAARGKESLVLGLQQQAQHLLQSVQQQLAAADTAARELWAQAQQQFGSAAARSSRGSSHDSYPGHPFDGRLERLCEQHPLADIKCKGQLLQQAQELEAQHQQQRQQRRAALSAFLAGTRQSGITVAVAVPMHTDSKPRAAVGSSRPASSSSDASNSGWEAPEVDCTGGTCSTADGWSADEHAVFLHEQCACMGPGGGGESALVQQLAALLPARSQHQVLQHERWYKEASRLQAAAQQLERGWQQQAAAFLAAAAALLAESEAAQLAEAEAAVQQLEAAAACLRCADSLDQWQAAKEQEEAQLQPQQLLAAATAAAQEAAKQQSFERYRVRMKQLLAQHQQRLEEQAAEAAAAEAAASAAAAQEAAAAAAAGHQRVQYRQQQAASREAARQQLEQQRQAEAARRQAALEQLRRQVAPAGIQRDAERARGATLSSSAAPVDRRPGVFAQALGFTTDQVLADQRFKVYEALRSLGLHTTAAGRQAMAGARPPRALRPDTLTSGQRQGRQS